MSFLQQSVCRVARAGRVRIRPPWDKHSVVFAPPPTSTRARSRRHASLSRVAVLAPALALLLLRCGAAGSPAPVAPAAAVSGDASAPAWAVPEVPVARPNAVVLLQPPPQGPDASSIVAIRPDPAPLVERSQWVYDLRYDRGEVFLVGVHLVTLPAPRETPRVMGRFALELYSGKTLLERVRFDFPGLGAPDRGALPDRRAAADSRGAPAAASTAALMNAPDAGHPQPLHGGTFSFSRKLSTRIGVMLPATARGTSLSLWDRATDQRWPLSWPAVELTTVVPEEADGGAP